MSFLPNNLLDYVNECKEKHPHICSKTIEEILLNIPLIKRVDGFELAFVVEKKLGLSQNYFAKALAKQTELKAIVIKENGHILVKLDSEIKKLLDDCYICFKIDKFDVDSYDVVINLSKRTLLGFYK